MGQCFVRRKHFDWHLYVVYLEHAQQKCNPESGRQPKNVLGTDILEELKYKAQVLMNKTGIKKVPYAIFARSGFTPALEELAKAEGVGLFPVESLVKTP